MKIYQTTKESAYSNRIVKELNAAVCTATFPEKDGLYLADLYTHTNSSDKLVYHNSCAPVNSTFLKTVAIDLIR